MTIHLNPTRPGAQGLLIRHAEREPILLGDSVWKAPLTDNGRKAAVELGRTLCPFPFGAAYSSPVPRCIETAELLLKGWGHPTQSVEADRLLLSAYIETPELAKAHFTAMDPFQIILDHVNGVPLEGFYSVPEGSRLLLDALKQKMRSGALTLFVTHDALLMPFRSHYLSETYTKQRWLPFLGSAALYTDESGDFVDDARVNQ